MAQTTGTVGAPVRHVLVGGYGTMGRGIALSFAAAGFAVSVVAPEAGEIGPAPPGIRLSARLPEQAPDLVVEAIPEQLELKTAFFQELERSYGAGPILASNSSGLPLEAIAGRLARPERFLGIHYYHPAETIPVVELVRLAASAEEAVERAAAALRRTGKEICLLRKPVVGFLLNRLQHAMLHEAYHLIEEGVVTVEEVDRAAQLAIGPRMCVTGLIRQKDLGGLDIHALAQRSILPTLWRSAEPSPLVQERYARNELGAKTGTGFYDWRGVDLEDYHRRCADKLRRILDILAEA